MLKPLLRVLPTLSGNVKLASYVTDYIKKSNDTYECYVRNADLLPLTSSLMQYDIHVNLLQSSYEYDLKRFYLRYSSCFYDNLNTYRQNEIDKVDKTNPINIRNTDFEMGAKRVSYVKSGNDVAFFAPIWIEGNEDIPEYLLLTLKFTNGRNNTSKKVKILINGEHKLNYLYKYIYNYSSKIDCNVLSVDVNNTIGYYHSIDLVHGGFTKAKDNIIRNLFIKQNSINNFDATICNGFKRMKCAIRQVLPLSFYLDTEKVLSEYERKLFKNCGVSISGQYYNSDNQPIQFYDFQFNYEELYLNQNKFDSTFKKLVKKKNQTNVMDLDYPSMKEAKFVGYNFSNKIGHVYSRWKLTQSPDDNPYYANNSLAFTTVYNKSLTYGEYPSNFENISAYVQTSLPLSEYYGKSQNNLLIPFSNEYEKNGFTYINNQYESIYNKYCLNWFDTANDLSEMNWEKVKDNKTLYKGVLYNFDKLKDEYGDNVILDYFGIRVNINFENVYDYKTSIPITCEYVKKYNEQIKSYSIYHNVIVKEDNNGMFVDKSSYRKQYYCIEEFVVDDNTDYDLLDKSVTGYALFEIPFGYQYNDNNGKNVFENLSNTNEDVYSFVQNYIYNANITNDNDESRANQFLLYRNGSFTNISDLYDKNSTNGTLVVKLHFIEKSIVEHANITVDNKSIYTLYDELYKNDTKLCGNVFVKQDKLTNEINKCVLIDIANLQRLSESENTPNKEVLSTAISTTINNGGFNTYNKIIDGSHLDIYKSFFNKSYDTTPKLYVRVKVVDVQNNQDSVYSEIKDRFIRIDKLRELYSNLEDVSDKTFIDAFKFNGNFFTNEYITSDATISTIRYDLFEDVVSLADGFVFYSWSKLTDDAKLSYLSETNYSRELRKQIITLFGSNFSAFSILVAKGGKYLMWNKRLVTVTNTGIIGVDENVVENLIEDTTVNNVYHTTATISLENVVSLLIGKEDYTSSFFELNDYQQNLGIIPNKIELYYYETVYRCTTELFDWFKLNNNYSDLYLLQKEKHDDFVGNVTLGINTLTCGEFEDIKEGYTTIPLFNDAHYQELSSTLAYNEYLNGNIVQGSKSNIHYIYKNSIQILNDYNTIDNSKFMVVNDYDISLLTQVSEEEAQAYPHRYSLTENPRIVNLKKSDENINEYLYNIYNINIWKENDNTYGLIDIQINIDNTSYSLNLLGLLGTRPKYITEVQGLQLNEQQSLELIYKQYTENLIPFIKVNLYDTIFDKIEFAVKPTEYNVQIHYKPQTTDGITDVVFHNEVLKNATTYRYNSDLTPLILPTESFVDYNIKYKYTSSTLLKNILDKEEDIFPLYKQQLSIDQMNMVRIYKEYNNEYDNYIPTEYKHFNDSFVFSLEKEFEIEAISSNDIDYNELIVLEQDDVVFDVFMNYMRNFTTSKLNGRELSKYDYKWLFLRYKIEYDSTTSVVKNDTQLYTLKYIFKLY